LLNKKKNKKTTKKDSSDQCLALTLLYCLHEAKKQTVQIRKIPGSDVVGYNNNSNSTNAKKNPKIQRGEFSKVGMWHLDCHKFCTSAVVNVNMNRIRESH
jgi:hypothetical protein